MEKTVIDIQGIKREFIVGDETVHALRGVSFSIKEGEFVTIMGSSGSGKSTLLNILGCLDTPTAGEYYLDGISVRKMSKNKRAILRNRKIGFVFQNYNLLAKTTAIENVELPLMYNADVSASERRARAIAALQAVGLGDRMEHKSNQMSGGQMQRVAIARALVNNPAVILADEATGNLDTRTSFEILVLFQKLHAEGRTIIFVTHNPEISNYSSRNIRLMDGHVTEDKVNTNILSAEKTLASLPVNEDD
ncbi:MAG: ABC transporter ATP-binding protein [Bacteroidetes bacterium]|uniref:ABC transporter ATP-binding protein n=1 Tax=Candidatus Cryptobacteroides intestinigallinarum TaxID=2840767 RepID=A0A9D9N0J5_9BACT|nr:ABC transporter ATP-binding protein [Candidatus Cryptobacteroides intestinigallinarum]